MAERPDFPCPLTGTDCTDYCGVACLRDDPAVWPDIEPDELDLGETVPWPMGGAA